MNPTYLNYSFAVNGIKTEVQIDRLGADKNVHPTSFIPHSHSMYEVYFIERENMTVKLGENTLDLKEHDILIIAPQTEHCICAVSDALGRFNFRFVLDVDLSFNRPYILYRPVFSVTSEIFDSIKHINEQIDKNDSYSQFRIRSYLAVLISYIIESINKNAHDNASLPKRRPKLDLYIELDKFFSKNYPYPITLDTLAEKLHYSKAHVNRLMKEYCNASFSEQLANTRIAEAKKLLERTDLRVGEIAKKCGYGSLRGFEMLFFKREGLHPTEYRKQFR